MRRIHLPTGGECRHVARGFPHPCQAGGCLHSPAGIVTAAIIEATSHPHGERSATRGRRQHLSTEGSEARGVAGGLLGYALSLRMPGLGLGAVVTPYPPTVV